jgi:DUF4097 and DUF4098 domain-containing protein YvlB
VTGEQRDGMLEVVGARSVDIQTRRVNVRLDDVSDTVDVEAVDGGFEAKGLKGHTTLDTRRVGVRIDGQPGRIDIEGQDGRVEVRGLAAELHFDGTRLPLTAEMDTAVPVTIDATEGSVDLRLPPAGVTVKVQSEEGSVQLSPGLPEPTRDGVRASLEAKVRGGGPLVLVTGTRTAITVKAP